VSEVGAPGPSGPALRRNWAVYDANDVTEMFEVPLYSDANFTTLLRRPDWPFDLLPTLPHPLSQGVHLALVARMRWCAPHPEWKPGVPTDEAAHHGGSIDDEIAALVALIYGVRCRSGGFNRHWYRDDDGTFSDPLGHPDEFNHVPPVWVAPPIGREMLPSLKKDAALLDGISFLESLQSIPTDDVIVLIRAARLYSNAVWIADSDPNLAWIQLVSAVEAVATHHARTEPRWKRVELAMPKVWKLLAEVGRDHAELVGSELAHLANSTARFLTFLEDYAPGPPEVRPAGHQLDWEDLRSAFRQIYGYRSRALHDGTPFPDPMCEPARAFDDGVIVEAPYWIDSRSGTSVWRAEVVPMYLHLFEHIAQSALLSWWHQRAAGSKP